MPRWEPLILIGLTLAAAGLRFARIGHDSLWEDEAASVLYARLPVGVLLANNVDPANPPGYRVLLKGWMALFGDGEGAVRSLSALFGVATIPVVWLLARQLTGCTATALAATAAMTLAPQHIFISQEARAYALALLLASVSTLLLLGALERGGAVRWGGYVLVAGVSAYVHYQMLLVIFGQSIAGAAACILARRDTTAKLSSPAGAGVTVPPEIERLHHARMPGVGEDRARGAEEARWSCDARAFCRAQLVLAALLIPCLGLYLGRGLLQPGGYSCWQGPPSWSGLATVLLNWTVGEGGRTYLAMDLALRHKLILLGLLLLPGALFVAGRRASYRGPCIVYGLSLYAGVTAFGILTLWKPVWHAKYLSAFQPLYLIGLVSVIALLPRRVKGMRGLSAVGVVLVLAVVFGRSIREQYAAPWRADYRGASADLHAADPDGRSPVLVYKAAYLAAEYYSASRDERVPPPLVMFEATRGSPPEGAVLAALVTHRTPRLRTAETVEAFMAELDSVTAEHDRAFVVLSEVQLGAEVDAMLDLLCQSLPIRSHIRRHRVHLLEVGWGAVVDACAFDLDPLPDDDPDSVFDLELEDES